MIQVTGLYVYPVKSLQGISLDEARLAVRGFDYDRHWMVTNEAYEFVTQRQLPQMASISVSLKEDCLVLEAAGQSSLAIALALKLEHPIEVSVWHDRCLALDEGSAASRWLTETLGRSACGKLRLVRFAPDCIRPVDPQYLRGETAHTAFSDGFPYLVTAEESLTALNEQLVARGVGPIGMDRFRPNIVIRGGRPFEEDRIDTLAVVNGSYKLGMRKPCQRCAITTTDQTTGQRPDPKEPLRTLIQMNTQPAMKGAHFGQNATLLAGEGETVSVGDALTGEIETCYRLR